MAMEIGIVGSDVEIPNFDPLGLAKDEDKLAWCVSRKPSVMARCTSRVNSTTRSLGRGRF